MKRLIFRTLEALGAAVLLLAPAVYAQTLADVPFDFQVGYDRMPAGEYLVQPTQFGSPAISITNRQTRETKMVLTDTITAGNLSDTGKLVFNRYGDRYFLSQVWRAGFSTGCLLHKSKAEREIARASAGNAALVAVKAR